MPDSGSKKQRWRVTFSNLIFVVGFVACTLLLLIALGHGCDSSVQRTVVYVLPANYRGPIWLVEHQDAPAITANGSDVTFVVPPNGLLTVRSLEPILNWHAIRVRDEHGKLIESELGLGNIDRMSFCLRGGQGGNVTFRGQRAHVLRYYVGSEDECRNFLLNNQPDIPK